MAMRRVPIRAVTIEDCEAVSREVSAQLTSKTRSAATTRLGIVLAGIDRPCSAPPSSRDLSVGPRSRCAAAGWPSSPAGPIARVEGENITFDVDGNEFAVRADNIEKARLVPDWPRWA
jgi:ribosome maturation factor RimP